MENDIADNHTKIFITGGAGFIGSALIRFIIENTNNHVLNFDKLTYAGNLENLVNVSKNNRYQFFKGDICNQRTVSKLLSDFQPEIIMHLAAETHVDRSIEGPSAFIKTNVVGTSKLLECSHRYWSNLENKKKFRFHHISTDEVYGSVSNENKKFSEKDGYDPSSPYSASKASSDHLVRAWYRTYGLPVIISNCSNNYGPYQFPEKLIPLIILNAIEGKPLPLYGNGENIRDWLYIEDHVKSLYRIVKEGRIGETYNIGGNNEKTNIEVVNAICEVLDVLEPLSLIKQNYTKENPKSGLHFKTRRSYKDLITFVPDRPGHDFRYAIDTNKIKNELNWKPEETFETGINKTVKWYLDNIDWCKKIQNKNYQDQRLGNLQK